MGRVNFLLIFLYQGHSSLKLLKVCTVRAWQWWIQSLLCRIWASQSWRWGTSNFTINTKGNTVKRTNKTSVLLWKQFDLCSAWNSLRDQALRTVAVTIIIQLSGPKVGDNLDGDHSGKRDTRWQEMNQCEVQCATPWPWPRQSLRKYCNRAGPCGACWDRTPPHTHGIPPASSL